MKQIQRILVLSHEFPPLGGGGGRILSHLCTELAARGYEVTVLTAAPPRGTRQEYPFRVVYFSTFRKARFKTSVLAMGLYLMQSLSYCFSGKAKGYDLLFSNMSIPAGVAGVLIRRLLMVSHAIWYHNTEITENRPHGAGPLFRWAYRIIGKRAEINLFISNNLMKLAASYGKIPGMGVLPNAVGPSDLPLMRYESGEKVFLFAGRMETVKGPLLLVEAIAHLRNQKKIQGLRFCMVGGGSRYDAVARRISALSLTSMVTLKKAVPHEQMTELFRSAYALVLPSRVEGYPTTVLEAGVHGVPAIATDTIGNNDAITHNETGLLVPLDDPLELAGAIVWLAGDPDLRNRLGAAACKRAGVFTIKNSADAFEKALSRL